MGRVLIVLGSLLILIVTAGSPTTASGTTDADTAVMCRRQGSVCTDGRQCCSKVCEGPLGEAAYCAPDLPA